MNVDWIDHSEHAFDMAARFTHRTVGWRTLPAGGRVPIREPITPLPYWRWYCRCGAVGGKFKTEMAAVNDHARHKAEREAGQ